MSKLNAEEPAKAGDKFYSIWDDEKQVRTVKSFFSHSGIEYDTAEKARWMNGRWRVCTKNVEHNGTTNTQLDRLHQSNYPFTIAIILLIVVIITILNIFI